VTRSAKLGGLSGVGWQVGKVRGGGGIRVARFLDGKEQHSEGDGDACKFETWRGL